MRRRDFFALGAGAAAWPIAARGEMPARLARIGYLSPGSRSSRFASRDEAFRRALQELGYVEGRNLIIDSRYAEGRFDRLPELAAELVALEVEVIVAVLTQASLAARQATATIPIVMVAVSDPVGAGLVVSLSRPNANVTGTSSMTAELVGKSLGLLKEAAPHVARVALVWNPDNAVMQKQSMHEAEAAARVLGMQIKAFGVSSAAELDRAFATIAASDLQGLFVLGDPLLALHHRRIVAFAAEAGLPALYGTKEFAAAGGLLAYSSDMEERFRRTAAYVDRILKGAKPADLPVEQPTRFELVINLRTAKALGLDVPPTLLIRADQVIE
jgi:putative ABC transport system substrate-binding protein